MEPDQQLLKMLESGRWVLVVWCMRLLHSEVESKSYCRLHDAGTVTAVVPITAVLQYATIEENQCDILDY